VEAYITRVRNNLSTVWNVLRSGLETAWNAAKTVFERILSYITNIRTRIANAAAGIWDGLKNGLSAVINTIISGINFIIRAINRVRIPSIGIGPLKTPAIGFNLQEIQPVKLAKGGVVRPSSNGTFAQLAEAGKSERVEPLDAQGLSVRDRAIIAELSGGKGTTVNMVINPSAGMDERELAAIVSRQIAFQLRRGAA
jgi:phage-related protein